MKICFISSDIVGGFKSFLINTIKVLKKRGIEVSIIYIGTDNINFQLVDFSSIDLIEEHCNKKNPYQIRQIIEEIRYSLFHSKHKDQLKHRILNYQIKMCRKVINYSIQIDLSEFDCVISSEEVLCNYFLANNVISKRKIGYIHPNYIMANFDKYIDWQFLKKLDCICATSHENAKTLMKVFPRLKNRIFGIPNPLYIEDIITKSSQKIEENYDQNLVNIITVCRLDNSSKALDRLIKIAKKLKDNNYRFVWRVIGEGWYHNEMKRIINNNNLQNHILLLGYYDNPIPFVKESDLFVLQSYYEGYPMSVCEAIIVNTPVLVTNYPSSKEQIIDGITGYIVNNDFESIYEKIRYLIENKNELHRIHSNLLKIDKGYFENPDELIKIIKK